jgi:hypothetical protein
MRFAPKFYRTPDQGTEGGQTAQDAGDDKEPHQAVVRCVPDRQDSRKPDQKSGGQVGNQNSPWVMTEQVVADKDEKFTRDRADTAANEYKGKILDAHHRTPPLQPQRQRTTKIRGQQTDDN